MKICVTAVAGSLDAQIDPRFGRCRYFIIVDPETMRFEAISNVSASALSGAGIQAAQMVVNKGVNVVITGQVGPNAYQVLSSAGIKIVTGAFGTVREAVEAYKTGRLREMTYGPSIRPGFGMGIGRGMGWSIPPQLGPSPLSKEQEVKMLEDQIKVLQQQLEEIKRRLKELRR